MEFDDLPSCTGVIVPGYDRAESLCQTAYVPNRHAVAFNKPDPSRKQVRIVYTTSNGTVPQTAEVQVSTDGITWVSTQEVELDVTQSWIASGLPPGYTVTQTLPWQGGQVNWNDLGEGSQPEAAREPVSLWSVRTITTDEVLRRYSEHFVPPFGTRIGLWLPEKLEGEGDGK